MVIIEGSYSNPDLQQIANAHEGNLGVMILSDDSTAAAQLSRLPLRSWGLLPLDASGEELRAAANALYEGLIVGAPELLGPSITWLGDALARENEKLTVELTEREKEVLQYLSRGLANKQISQALAISEHTVKFHLSSIYAKLGVANRAEAVRAGIQRGLISL
jgi:DNA-binding NarL/FixJ family response regulator